jgi:translation initiation factor IF-3
MKSKKCKYKCKCKKHKKKKKLKDYLAEIDEMKLVAEAAYEDGFRYGVKLGVAKKLLEFDVNIEIVLKATGLTLADIEKLNDERR